MYQRRLEIVYHGAWLTIAEGGPAGASPTAARIHTFLQCMAEPRDDASRVVSNALSIFLKLASNNDRRAIPIVNNRISASLQHRARTPGCFTNSLPPPRL